MSFKRTLEGDTEFGEILIIDDFSQVIGNFNVYSDVRIDGYVEGNLQTPRSVVINENGSFKGNIICKNIIIYGHIDGNVDVEQFAILKSSSVCKGILHTRKLEVDQGCVLNIQIRMNKSEQNQFARELNPVWALTSNQPKVIVLKEDGDKHAREYKTKRVRDEKEDSISNFFRNKLKN